MGKPRKIVIDDTIPCNKEGECLFPRINNHDEFWPLIITKAILKLFSFKYKSTIYSNNVIGDIQLFYSLTGYIPEIINFDYLKKISLNINKNSKHKENYKNNNNNDNDSEKDKEIIMNFINKNIQDDNFFNKKNFLMVFYNSNEDKNNINIEKHLFKHSINHKMKLGIPKKCLILESSIKKIAFGSTPQNPKKLESKKFIKLNLIKFILFYL
jgi:hypothetical protein